jgi:hypothetical protein
MITLSTGPQDLDVRAGHEPVRTNIAPAIDLVETAIRHTGPLGGGVFDAWDLAEDVVLVLARRRQDWISRLNKNRLLETASVHLRDANGWTLQRPRLHLAVEELVPLIPATVSRPVNVGEPTSGCLTLTGRIPGLGKVRRVVSVLPALAPGYLERPVHHPLADRRQELPPADCPDHPHGQEKPVAHSHPLTGHIQTHASHQTVEVRMQDQHLTPGMPRRDDAGPGTQIVRIA